MNDSEQFDELLKQVLSQTAAPSEALNQEIKDQLKEREIMRLSNKKRFASILIAAALIMAMSITAFGAWNLLNSKQYAERSGDKALARAFETKDAIQINKSAVSHGYKFTLHGIVSGKGISDFVSSAESFNPERTYAVVSIQKEDGSKMPGSQDEEYGKTPFFISPLIKGQKPWQVNIASMNGGYSESVIDGVMYRLIECDGIEMFADRGIYLCISSSNFYDIKAYDYNPKTGEITPKADYDGFNVLFDLPIDKTKADHKKAEQYLQQLLNPKEEKPSPEEAQNHMQNIEEDFKDGIVIPESVKEITFDKDGMAHYGYDGMKMSITLGELFKDGKTGSKYMSTYGDDKESFAVKFVKEADGKIKGMVVKRK